MTQSSRDTVTNLGVEDKGDPEDPELPGLDDVAGLDVDLDPGLGLGDWTGGGGSGLVEDVLLLLLDLGDQGDVAGELLLPRAADQEDGQELHDRVDGPEEEEDGGDSVQDVRLVRAEVPVLPRTEVEGVEISGLHSVEDEGPHPEPPDYDPVDQTLLPRVPGHGHSHRWSVCQGYTDPEHEAVGEGSESHAVLDGEVGEEDTRTHEGRA